MRLIILIAGFLITGNTMGQHRPLLIFANEANSQLVQQQTDLLNKSAAGVKERAIKITIVEKDSPLLKKYKINAAQFTVILIGKDGYEKYRINKILETDHLFAIIDAMPMRISEMKKTGNKK